VHRALLGADCRVSDLNVRSLGLCYLAVGSFDAFVSFRQETVLYDLLAGFIVAKEAGALVTDGEGKALRSASNSDTIVVAAPGVSRTLLACLKERG
jgi:myo-inositol-1(or 4)-monophosphatase